MGDAAVLFRLFLLKEFPNGSSWFIFLLWNESCCLVIRPNYLLVRTRFQLPAVYGGDFGILMSAQVLPLFNYQAEKQSKGGIDDVCRELS
jgi:hypothetical protein